MMDLEAPCVIGILDGVPTAYSGSLTNATLIAQFMDDLVSYNGNILTDGSSTELRFALKQQLHRPKLVLFTTKSTAPLMFKVLSHEYGSSVDFHLRTHASVDEVSAGRSSLPAIVAFRSVDHQQSAER